MTPLAQLGPYVSWVTGAAAAVVTSLVTFAVASRRLSGKIGTSEAAQLWEESKAIREDYRAQIAERDLRIAEGNKRIVSLEARVAAVEADNNALVRDNLNQAAKVRDYEQTIALVTERLKVCEDKLHKGAK